MREAEIIDFLRARFDRQEQHFERIERMLNEIVTRLDKIPRRFVVQAGAGGLVRHKVKSRENRSQA
jgi:hypothetical protein